MRKTHALAATKLTFTVLLFFLPHSAAEIRAQSITSDLATNSAFDTRVFRDAVRDERFTDEVFRRIDNSDFRLEGVVSLSSIVSLARDEGIPIVIDTKALRDDAIRINLELSFPEVMPAVPKTQILELVLARHELALMPEGQLLLVSTKTAEAERQVIRVYRIGHLMAGAGSESYDYDTLINTITNSVEPDAWEENGGNSSIEPYPAGGALVIATSRRVHDAVSKLFMKLGRAVATTPLSQPGPVAQSGHVDFASAIIGNTGPFKRSNDAQPIAPESGRSLAIRPRN